MPRHGDGYEMLQSIKTSPLERPRIYLVIRIMEGYDYYKNISS